MYVAFRPMIIRILRMPRGHRRCVKLNCTYNRPLTDMAKMNHPLGCSYEPGKKDILRYIRKIILFLHRKKKQNK